MDIKCLDIDFDKIIESGQVFRCRRLSDYKVEFITNQTKLLIVETEIGFTVEQFGFEIDVYKYFDLERNYEDIYRKVKESDDKFLQNAVEAGKGLRLLKQDLWEMIVSFIISQRNNIKRIKDSIEHLCRDCGCYYKNGDYYGFPSPEQIFYCNKSLSYLGYREEYIRLIAKKIIDNEFDLEALYEMSEDEAFKTLLSVRGIGPKVANCILLFGLAKIDAFPIDVWIQRVLDKYYNGTWNYGTFSGINGILQMYIFFFIRNNS